MGINVLISRAAKEISIEVKQKRNRKEQKTDSNESTCQISSIN